MAIMEISSSKSSPAMALDRIFNSKNLEAYGVINLVLPSDPNPLFIEEEMLSVHQLFHKPLTPDAIKFFHFSIRFHPSDRAENSGPLDALLASNFAKEYAQAHWPDRQVVWAVLDNDRIRRIRFVVNSVSMQTGMKLNIRRDIWRQWKNDCQALCRKYGLFFFDNPL